MGKIWKLAGRRNIRNEIAISRTTPIQADPRKETAARYIYIYVCQEIARFFLKTSHCPTIHTTSPPLRIINFSAANSRDRKTITAERTSVMLSRGSNVADVQQPSLKLIAISHSRRISKYIAAEQHRSTL